MKSRTWFVMLALVVSFSMLLGACTPAAAPTAAPAATTAPAATEAPVATVAPAATEAATVAPTAAPAPVEGGRFTYIEAGGFYSLDPYQTPWFTLTQGAIYDSLVIPNLELNGYTGVLADSWDVAADGLSVTFHLKKGVTFSDGTPFNATAAKWNLDKYLDPKWPKSINGTWPDAIKEFQAPDDNTVVFVFKTPYAPIFSDLQLTYFVSPTAYEKLGQDKFPMAPVGTGAWIAKEIVPNDHVLYVKNPDYKWGASYFDNKGPVHFDELYIKFISDESVIYAALETGEATLAGLPTQFLDKAKTNPKLVVGNGIDWSDWYLGMNDSKAPFDNKDFRIAVAYAINRDEIIQAAWGGEAFALYSSLPPSTYGYQESQNEYGKAAEPYDPAKAKELLATLGYVADSSGVLAKDGKELSFKLNFPAGDPTKRAAETIQAQLAEVGIKVELGQMEAAAISDMLKKCDQEFFMRPFGLSDGSILSAVFASARMNASNRNCFVEAETDKLIAAADSAMDPTARMAALDALVKHLVDVRPHIPLWANYLYTAYQANLQGLKFDKAGNAYFNDAYFAK